MSAENETWAMQQVCPSPLAKLLLWRIASGMGDSGRQTFDCISLERFAGCGFADYYAAMDALVGAGLIRHFGSVGDYCVDLAMPWYQRPDPRELPRRKLQTITRIREGLTRLQDGLCWYCGKALADCHGTPHVEHQTPLSRGGADAFDNLVMACGRCNSDKGDRTLEEYRQVVAGRDSSTTGPFTLDDAMRFAGERWS